MSVVTPDRFVKGMTFAAREFAALQNSPFFDLWACAGIDEILSALYERLVVGDR